MSAASVVIIGAWRDSEFARALDWLRDQADCTCFDTATAATDHLRSFEQHRDPAAVLLVQSRPGQISAADVERLYAAAPLARLVALVGSWCEGEMRSGRPWPGVVRVPWRSWRNSLPRALALGEPGSAATLPRTASDIDRIKDGGSSPAGPGQRNRTAAICASDRATFDSIADALWRLGIDGRWQCQATDSSAGSVDLMVFDGWDEFRSGNHQAAWSAARKSPKIVLLDFPRAEDIDRAAEYGATVVALPMLLADLAIALERLLPDCAAISSRSLTAAGDRN